MPKRGYFRVLKNLKEVKPSIQAYAGAEEKKLFWGDLGDNLYIYSAPKVPTYQTFTHYMYVKFTANADAFDVDMSTRC